MKYVIKLLLVTVLLAAPLLASAQQLYQKNAYGEFVPVLQTNAVGEPFLAGPAIDLIRNIGTWTNWGVAGFGIYEPGSGSRKAAYGGGMVALYNINTYMATGIGVDMLNNDITMPSGQFQLQAPLYLGGTNGVTVTPFAFTGIATPIGGAGDNNGTVVGLFGAGLDVKIYGGFGAFYAIEQRTGQPDLWHLFGLRYSTAF